MLSIESGRLGPLEPTVRPIEVRPLTLFVGRQGTGKSLLAQMLYLFRGLPDLARFDASSLSTPSDPKAAFRRIADGLRSSHRSFANLTKPNVSIKWTGDLAVGTVHARTRTLGFNAQHVTRQVLARKEVCDVIEQARRARSQPLAALFLPTERLLYSVAVGPTSLSVIGVPLVLEVFATWMDRLGRIAAEWPKGVPDTHQGVWVRDHLEDALGGHAERRGDAWRWSFDDGKSGRAIDLDMASSGQRANWPLALAPQALFSLRARGRLAHGFTLFVEEPEIHLHPRAEQAVAEVLAFLVKNGIRVVLTTHSLTVLYTINNLLLASGVDAAEMRREVPPEARLDVSDVAAYHVRPDGKVGNLMTNEGLIDERALGEVADEMASVMNRLHLLRSEHTSR